MRTWVTAILLGTLTCLSACGESPTPLTPTPPPDPPAPNRPVPNRPATPTPIPGPSIAALSISNIRVGVVSSGGLGLNYFNLRFLLTETTGKSGATILNIESTAGAGSDNTGAACWVDPIRVEPGGTTNAFDAGWDDLLYCAPFAVSPDLTPLITIVVTFLDDDRHAGTVTGKVTVPR